ncbi:MAG: RagB/SusD family nutrient uptake outer membrane protein, partial [Muribaculaceae bacterium]|nr:RagB/SusD family nutrient uptake outer membrane protein [Muribaculaceae bacterium]
MKKIILSSILGLGLLASCAELDIAPKGMMTEDDLLSNDAGMEIYMAEIYSNLPLEDFKYLPQRGHKRNGWLVSKGVEGTGEAVGRDGIVAAFTGEEEQYWGSAFSTLRKINTLIEDLPNYQGNYSSVAFNDYLGHAYFLRAYI